MQGLGRCPPRKAKQAVQQGDPCPQGNQARTEVDWGEGVAASGSHHLPKPERRAARDNKQGPSRRGSTVLLPTPPNPAQQHRPTLTSKEPQPRRGWPQQPSTNRPTTKQVAPCHSRFRGQQGEHNSHSQPTLAGLVNSQTRGGAKHRLSPKQPTRHRPAHTQKKPRRPRGEPPSRASPSKQPKGGTGCNKSPTRYPCHSRHDDERALPIGYHG